MNHNGTMQRRAFTVMELLVAISVIAILATLLFPVFAKAKNAARQSACLNNLKNIGAAFLTYMEGYDDTWPFGVDPADKYTPQIWNGFPEFQKRILDIPLMHDLLDTYLPSRSVWECPADKGQIIDDVSFELMNSTNSYKQYGTSYYYRTELTVRSLTTSNLPQLAEINVYFDGSGAWHTGVDLLRESDTWEEMEEKLRRYRYNVLFGDMHVKNITRAQYEAAWQLPVKP